MNKFYPRSFCFPIFLLFCLFIVSSNSIKAQNSDKNQFLIPPHLTDPKENYKTILLPVPPIDFTIGVPLDLSILGNEQGVYLGAKPQNFNGKVLAIHSGLFSKPDASSVFFGEHYKYFYEKGFGIAFFSTSGYHGDFFNGESMARGIDEVVKFYGVDKISLVGLSNGGVASEVAMFMYDKSKFVDKVYALGTPYYGSFLADLFTMSSPIVGYPIVFLIQEFLKFSPEGEQADVMGTILTSVIYRSTILRPYIDELEENRPKDFYLALSKNYVDFPSNDFASIFESTALLAFGLLQDIVFFSENDGVTPYFSGHRPGAVLDDEFKDIGVHHNRLTGNTSKASLETLAKMVEKYSDRKTSYSTATLRKASNRNAEPVGRNLKFKSNFQISSNGSFRLDANSKNEALIYDFGEAANIVSEQKNQTQNTSGKSSSSFRKSHLSEQDIHNRIVKKISIAEEKKLNFRLLSNTEANNESKFLIQENVEASLEIDYNRGIFQDKYNPYPTLLIDVKSLNELQISKNEVSVKATATRIADLKGQPVIQESLELNFVYNPETHLLEAETLYQKDGVYTLNIRIDHKDFRRDILGGYTVGTLFDSVVLENTENATSKNKSSLSFDPKNKQLYFELVEKKNLSQPYLVQIFEANGRIVSHANVLPDFSHNILSIGNDKINLDLKKGSYYFVSIDDGIKKYNHKILVQ